MADKLSTLLLEALGRASLAPGGSPLFGTKAAPGLFPATAAARPAAQRARDDGLIRMVAADASGNADRDRYSATDGGLAFLLRQTSPKQVLEDLARAIEARQTQAAELVTIGRETQTELAAMKRLLAQVLPNMGEPAASEWLADLHSHLTEWETGGAAGDCPLPDLYRRLQAGHATLSIGRFHDGLRELHEREQVYLHPWTGPLYAMPEPAYALLIGHEIAYYANLRSDKRSAISDKPAHRSHAAGSLALV